MSEIKLYNAYTLLEEFRGFKNVTINFFVSDREKPAVDFRDAIQGYDGLDSTGRLYSEEAVNELFTESEIELLRQQVETVWGLTLDFDQRNLPIPNNQVGIGAISYGGLTGQADFSRCDDYTLPFKVHGYFDLRCCEDVYGLPEKGVDFAKALAHRLGFTLPQDAGKLLQIVRDIYDDTGLYVELGKTKAEREAEEKRERDEFERAHPEDSPF